jgi:glycosyltransferase involved in cell wall biosynthesis
MEALFFIAAVGALYSYLLYPFLLSLLPGRVARPAPGNAARDVSLVIAARNEQARIAAKLEDALSAGKGVLREIVVVSDGSDDGTDAAVGGYSDRGVRLVRQSPRRGKESAQALGLASTSGEFIVFSDVATRIAPGSFEAIAGRLAEPGVGAISSEDRFEARDGKLSGEGAYVRYEMWLRRLESDRAGLVGLSGSLFAARREVCEDWRTDVPSDFTVALNCARKGLRAVSDSRVVGVYPDLQHGADEFARKRRTVVRGMAALAAAPELLNVGRYGLFAFQVWSHKVMRWLVPWFLLVLLPVSAALADDHGVYALALLAQIAFYGLAAAGWLSPRLRELTVVRIPYYFLQVNAAILFAGLDYLRGRRVVVWEPSRR